MSSVHAEATFLQPIDNFAKQQLNLVINVSARSENSMTRCCCCLHLSIALLFVFSPFVTAQMKSFPTVYMQAAICIACNHIWRHQSLSSLLQTTPVPRCWERSRASNAIKYCWLAEAIRTPSCRLHIK